MIQIVRCALALSTMLPMRTMLLARLVLLVVVLLQLLSVVVLVLAVVVIPLPHRTAKLIPQPLQLGFVLGVMVAPPAIENLSSITRLI